MLYFSESFQMPAWSPREAAILHCFDTFMLAFIVTPKSFSFTVPPIIWSTGISWFTPVFPCPACRHLHVSKLNNICHFSDRMIKLSMSSCSCCLSPFPLIFPKKLIIFRPQISVLGPYACLDDWDAS